MFIKMIRSIIVFVIPIVVTLQLLYPVSASEETSVNISSYSYKVLSQVNGSLGNSDSENPQISADGKWVVFQSYASNLVPSDNNDQTDIFIRNTQTGQITAMFTRNGATYFNGNSHSPVISSDGNLVAFISEATNVIPGENDTNNWGDVFLYFRNTKELRRINKAVNGSFANFVTFEISISSNNKYVVFDSYASNLVQSDTNGTWDIFLYNVNQKTLKRVSISDSEQELSGASVNPVVSDTGIVAFQHRRSDDYWEILARFTQTGQTRVVSQDSGRPIDSSCMYPVIRSDGTKIYFTSNYKQDSAMAGIGLYELDVTTNILKTVFKPKNAGIWSGYLSLSQNGRFLLFMSNLNIAEGFDGSRFIDLYDLNNTLTQEVDPNGTNHIYMIDTLTSTISRLSGHTSHPYKYTFQGTVSNSGNAVFASNHTFYIGYNIVPLQIIEAASGLPITVQAEDVDKNGVINEKDIKLILENYQKNDFLSNTDLDKNNKVNVLDIAMIINIFNS